MKKLDAAQSASAARELRGLVAAQVTTAFDCGLPTFRDNRAKITYIRLPQMLCRPMADPCRRCAAADTCTSQWDTLVAPDNGHTHTAHSPNLKMPGAVEEIAYGRLEGLAPGDRVQVVQIDGSINWDGTYLGSVDVASRGETLCLVELDEGRWIEGRHAFISLLVVHPDSVQRAALVY